MALKIPAGEGEVEALTEALELLARDAGKREAMGTAARRLVEAEHDVDRVAEAYAAALEEAVGGDAVRTAVLWEIATAAAETGIAPDDPETAELGRRLAEVGLGE